MFYDLAIYFAFFVSNSMRSTTFSISKFLVAHVETSMINFAINIDIVLKLHQIVGEFTGGVALIVSVARLLAPFIFFSTLFMFSCCSLVALAHQM